MTNKFISEPPVELVVERLKVLFENVNSIYQSRQTVLESDVVSAYHSALDQFIQSIGGSIVKSSNYIKKGTIPNPMDWNRFINAIHQDLKACFSEVGALDRIIVASFNSIMAEREQALKTSQRITNKIGDYLLYGDSKLGGGFFYGDSYCSMDRIEVGSDLVETAECFVSTEEGVVLLPLDGDPLRREIKSIIINSPSNGTGGSNYIVDHSGHSSIETVADGDPDSWFEYEKVTAFSSKTPLVLDMTITLKEISVINHIHINPIFFGSPAPVKISKIETSKDGKEYSSIKDEVPIKDFVSVEEDNVFNLSSSSGKNSGQGFYSFLPRKAQYVHVVLEQHTPYTIQTNVGQRLRYAIGLRDINIYGRKFQKEGSIISTSFSASKEIKKVSMWATQNPAFASDLSDIGHFVSYEDGGEWLGIQPQNRNATEIPEVINFNNVADNAISTTNPVQTLRHKAQFVRNTENFNGNITLKKEKSSKVETIDIPSSGDYSFQTAESPIEETLNIVLPFNGSYSCPRPRYGGSVAGKSKIIDDADYILFNVDQPDTGTIRYSLPFSGIENLVDKIRVFVNGEQYEYMSKSSNALANPFTSHTSAIDEDSKVYFLNKEGAEIQFGYTDSGGTERGYVPPSGSKIEICLDGDNPRFELTEKGYVLNLSSVSDGFKENTNLVVVQSVSDNEAEDYIFEIPTGKQKYKASLTEAEIFDLQKNESKVEKGLVVGRKKNAKQSLKKELEETPFYYSDVKDASFGILPNIFLPGTTNFEIIEYNYAGGRVEGALRTFTEKVEFIDGDTELRDSSTWEYVPERYSFDAETGSVYLGQVPPANRRVLLKCKKINAKIVPKDKWEFYKEPGTERTNTQKILVSPKHIRTLKSTKSFSYSANTRSIELFDNDSFSHSWYKKKLVKGTIIPSNELFPSSAVPTEVKFIDGFSEFNNTVHVQDETIVATQAGNIYSFTLKQCSANNVLVGNPLFKPVRSTTSVSTADSQFKTLKDESDTLSINGEWKYSVNSSTGIVTVQIYYNGTLNSHLVSYKFANQDTGVDINGLYSIDYDNGVVHFASDIPSSGDISFEFSMYSAFYNIAKPVFKENIESVSGSTVKFKPAFALSFLKQSEANKARPQILKVAYDYYKKSSESLADLEPYFSPILKDVAFKAITIDVLEEL